MEHDESSKRDDCLLVDVDLDDLNCQQHLREGFSRPHFSVGLSVSNFSLTGLFDSKMKDAVTRHMCHYVTICCALFK